MLKIGWCLDEPALTLGRQFTIKNLYDSAPEGLEIVQIDPENPQTCDAYVVHSGFVPTNLPVFPKLGLAGTILKKRPVIMYAHGLRVQNIGADITIFQSPLHKSFYKPCENAVIPPPILDRDFLSATETARQPLQLYFGTFSTEKGADVAIRMAETQKNETHFFGWKIPSDAGATPCCRFFTPVEHERVGELYATYTKLLLYPRMAIPFSRIVAEALLARMEVEVWGKIGLESFEEPLEAVLERARYQAASEFWNEVTKRL